MCLSQEWILMEISKVQVRGQQQDRGSWGHWWDLGKTLGETLGIKRQRLGNWGRRSSPAWKWNFYPWLLLRCQSQHMKLGDTHEGEEPPPGLWLRDGGFCNPRVTSSITSSPANLGTVSSPGLSQPLLLLLSRMEVWDPVSPHLGLGLPCQYWSEGPLYRMVLIPVLQQELHAGHQSAEVWPRSGQQRLYQNKVTFFNALDGEAIECSTLQASKMALLAVDLRQLPLTSPDSVFSSVNCLKEDLAHSQCCIHVGSQSEILFYFQ